METFLFPAAVAAVVFIAFLVLQPRAISSDQDRRKKSALEQITQEVEKQAQEAGGESVSVLKEAPEAPGVLASIPGMGGLHKLLLKAGLGQRKLIFFVSIAVVAVIFDMIMRWVGFPSLPSLLIGIAIAFFLGRTFLKKRVDRRVNKFLNLFPDASDMMVRSVRSGHPLNTAMRMIAENMDSPVSDEFRQVIDEVAYGRTLTEALQRMAGRVEAQDLNFFVVVLTVQQETGGSLAEVLTNLSGMLRKRKQLRLKIRALTSEGRAASYIMGALPVMEFAALKWTSPNYLDPFFTNGVLGYALLATSVILVIMAVWIIRNMADVEV